MICFGASLLLSSFKALRLLDCANRSADIFAIPLITIGALKAAIVYAKLTDGQDPAFARQIAFSTVILAAIVCWLFVFADQTLLGLFPISRPTFKIAGGLMALSALGMEIGPLVAGLGEPA